LFKNLGAIDKGIISCANKNSQTKLAFEGRGDIELELKDGRKIEIKNAIYSKNLAKNLLSLRKFVDLGLKIYLDNKYINIYDPINRNTIISGFYNKPFWEIELKSSNNEPVNSDKNKRIFVNLATRSGKQINKMDKHKE